MGAERELGGWKEGRGVEGVWEGNGIYRHLDFHVAHSDVLNGALEVQGVWNPCFDGFEMIAEWGLVRG